MKEQYLLFQNKLEEFAFKYKNEIQTNSEFRK